jgi:hypothetical protein
MCGGALSLVGGGLGGVVTSSIAGVDGIPRAVVVVAAGLVASKCSGSIVFLFSM